MKELENFRVYLFIKIFQYGIEFQRANWYNQVVEFKGRIFIFCKGKEFKRLMSF